MEVSFFLDSLSRSWGGFLSATGSTGLSFLAGSILQFFVAELSGWLVILVYRGRRA
jgi:hypothetical protein